jgi:hypothetical protein
MTILLQWTAEAFPKKQETESTPHESTNLFENQVSKFFCMRLMKRETWLNWDGKTIKMQFRKWMAEKLFVLYRQPLQKVFPIWQVSLWSNSLLSDFEITSADSWNLETQVSKKLTNVLHTCSTFQIWKLKSYPDGKSINVLHLATASTLASL